tara:strand:+ start:3762 stop:5126 length:1365 start_codon:yes stop_codon:yes gene_type:complete
MSIKKSEVNNDIYDLNLFGLDGFHTLEFENQIPFRWSDGIFKIIPKQKIKNLCLNFKSLNRERKIIIFLENKIKNIKHEFILEKDNEYIIILTIQDVDCISFHISPNMKINNEKEVRTLGLYVKKIYTNDIDVNSIELLNSNNISYTQYLVDKNNIETKKFIESSLYEQNSSIKFLDLNCTRRNFEFNSSIFKVNDKKYLMTRNSQFVSQKMTLNSLKLYEYDTLKQINLNLKEEVDFEQFEDPRVLVHNDKIYVSCATYVHDAFHLVHQKMLVFDKDFNHIDNIHFKYGFNGINLKENTGIEKNWTFFVYNDRLMCIYKLSPHTVLEFDWNGNLLTEYITHNSFQSNWKYGIPRGGTNPIYKDGYYISFFHSHIYWGKGKRRYFMGYYKFNPIPPFNIIETSNKPMLQGNEKDERIYPEENPLVVFPCGAILDEDKCLVSLGVNDEKTAILTI